MMQLFIEIILLGAAVSGILVVVLATFYDMRRVRSNIAVMSDMRRMNKRRQPHVSIIITDIDNHDELRQCLRYIKASRYEHYDVVAVISRIRPADRKRLMAMTSIKNFRIYSPRYDLNDRVLIKNAYQRSMRGAMIMTLRADDLVTPFAMKKAVALLQRNSLISGVKLLGEMNEPLSLIQLYGIFLELGDRLITKAFLAIGIKQRQSGLATGVYRYQSVIKEPKTRGDGYTFVFEHGLSASHAHNRHQPRQWSDWIVRLLFIATVTYGSIIAATLQSTWPLMMTWLIVCIWLMAVVWSDETTRLKRKLAISTCIPIAMFVITATYLMGAAATLFRLKTF